MLTSLRLVDFKNFGDEMLRMGREDFDALVNRVQEAVATVTDRRRLVDLT